MQVINWRMVLSAVIAGVMVLLIQEFAFTRKLNGKNELETSFKGS